MSRRNPLTRRHPSTVDCRAVGRWIQSYVDDELEPERRRQIAEHLEACRRCGLELSTYREIRASLGRERPEVAPAALDRLRRFAAALAEGPSAAD